LNLLLSPKHLTLQIEIIITERLTPTHNIYETVSTGIKLGGWLVYKHRYPPISKLKPGDGQTLIFHTKHSQLRSTQQQNNNTTQESRQ
jgi:hypothetical protein